MINQLPKENYENLWFVFFFIFLFKIRFWVFFLNSYLVRFLARIAERSSENKMTASNLGICIGCSILYAKDQLSNTSMSNSYASASIILELMIIYHKQLFINPNQQEHSTKSFKSQPDLIPTEFHPVYKIRFSFTFKLSSFFFSFKEKSKWFK